MGTEKLTYAMYASNPAIRDAIDLEVKRMRVEAMSRYVIAPLKGLIARMNHQHGRTPWIQPL